MQANAQAGCVVALQQAARTEEAGTVAREEAGCLDWSGEEAAALELFGEDALTM